MPVPGLFSAFYWPGDGLVNGAGPPSSTKYGYAYWFDGMTIGMTLVMPKVPRRVRKLIRRQGWKLWRLLPRRVQIIYLVARRLYSRDFAEVLKVVDWSSTSPDVRNMKEWNSDLAMRIGADPHVHENVSRCLAAYDRLPATLSRSDKMLMLELAWTGRKHS